MIYYSTRSRPVDTFGGGSTSQETNRRVLATEETTSSPFYFSASTTRNFATPGGGFSSDTRSTLKLADGESSTRYFLGRESSSVTNRAPSGSSGESESYTISQSYFTSYTIKSFSNGISSSRVEETRSSSSRTYFFSSSEYITLTNTSASTSTSVRYTYTYSSTASDSLFTQYTESGFFPTNYVITYSSSTILSSVNVYNYYKTKSETYATNYVGNSSTTFSTTLTRTTTYETESTQYVKGYVAATALDFAVVLEPIYEAENFLERGYDANPRNIIGGYNCWLNQTGIETDGPFLFTGPFFTKKTFTANEYLPKVTITTQPSVAGSLTRSTIKTEKTTETAKNSSLTFNSSEGWLITTRTQAFVYDKTYLSTSPFAYPDSNPPTYQDWMTFVDSTTRRIICATTGGATAEQEISDLFTNYQSYSKYNSIAQTRQPDHTITNLFGSTTRRYSKNYTYLNVTSSNYFFGPDQGLMGTSFSVSYGNTYTTEIGGDVSTMQSSRRQLVQGIIRNDFFGGKLPSFTDGPSSVYGKNIVARLTYLDENGNSTLTDSFYDEISENISNKQVAIDRITAVGLFANTYLGLFPYIPIVDSFINYDDETAVFFD